ncbi:aspartate aminotransferase family protein, partial [Paenibacillus thiaminolyticus]|nr:aspartate aminotransferase family protein [Paenibacillus thiaminolyticus]
AELQGAAGTDSAALTDAVLEAMKERGFIIGKNGIGRNVLAFQPPLVIEAGDIDAMLAALDDVLGGIEA